MARHQDRRDPLGPSGPSAVPLALTSLIGRTRELAGVSDLLRRHRLVTLVGPGGVGKTRVAVELCRRQAQQRHGCWFVELSSVAAAEDVAAETARILDIRDVSQDATTAVLRHLADRDVLLVLDTCEHLIDACAEFVSALLGVCPNLRILATSREPLALAGEALWRLDPLSPEHAHRLFLDRARTRNPGLVPDADSEAAILEICGKVDNLPLGIELAAGWVDVMSTVEIHSGLAAHLGELGRAPRGAPARHRTVAAAVEWSYKLLDPDEPKAFRSLAVFVGSFDVDAALAVAPGMSLGLLARLVDKSLVWVLPDGRGRTRYRLLDTVRAYAADRLDAAGELTAARTRHLQHFATIGIPAEEGWMSERVLEFLTERTADYGNIRAAVEWGLDSDPCAALRLLVATRDLFFILGLSDGRRLAELATERCPERGRDWAEAMIAAGQYAYLLGDGPAGIRMSTEAAEAAAELGERFLQGTAQFFLGLQHMMGGAPDIARGHLATALPIQQETGDLRGQARTTALLALTRWLGGDPRAARELFEAALAIGRAAGDRWSQGQANLYLGILTASSGDRQGAAPYFREAIECWRPYRDTTLLPMALIGHAGVTGVRDPRTALRIVAAAWAVRARTGGEFPPFFRTFVERTRAAVTAAVGEEADRLWREGSRLTVDDAVALALGASRPRPLPDLGVSQRELDVVRLVADGLSNKEIAARLHLSVRTVESHVRHALTKTGLVNRTQLATWARSRGG